MNNYFLKIQQNLVKEYVKTEGHGAVFCFCIYKQNNPCYIESIAWNQNLINDQTKPLLPHTISLKQKLTI